MSVKIDFIGIGAHKSGTSWLYENLKDLPDFSFTPLKEIHFFDRYNKYPSPNLLSEDKLTNRIRDKKWLKNATNTLQLKIIAKNKNEFKWYFNYYFSNYNSNWYKSLFKSLKGIKGEITPAYAILDKNDVEYMYRVAPATKIIFLLRNPIERAWSHCRFDMAKGYIPNYLKNNKLEDLISFIDSPTQDLRTNYVQTIRNYLTYFNNSQILIGFYDAIIDNPQGILEEIVEFIGGDSSQIKNHCKLEQKINISPPADIPDIIQEVLIDKYAGLIEQLHYVFGGYCTLWYEGLNHNKKESHDTILKSTIILNQKFQSLFNKVTI